MRSSLTTLPFRFGHRVVATLPTDGVFYSPISPATSSDACPPPTVAYIDLGTLRSLREKTLGVFYRARRNSPVARLRQRQLKKLLPANEAQDPYIAAVLIALAQEQQRMEESSTATDTTSKDAGRFNAQNAPPSSKAPPRHGGNSDSSSKVCVSLLLGPKGSS